ncbi:MAG: hypothetical protein ACLSD7_05070 [Coprococcus phoceensis]
MEVPVEKEDGEYLLLYYNPKEQKAEYVQKVEVKDGQTKFLIEKGGAYFIDKRASTKSLRMIQKKKTILLMPIQMRLFFRGQKKRRNPCLCHILSGRSLHAQWLYRDLDIRSL